MKLNRRNFIIFTGSSAGLLLAWNFKHFSFWEDKSTLAQLTKILNSKSKEITIVGKAYLDLNPSGSNKSLILDQLQKRFPSHKKEELSDQITQALSSDFSEGRIHVVDGWILSETECLLCALAYQQQG